jgi:hypothetical protein
MIDRALNAPAQAQSAPISALCGRIAGLCQAIRALTVFYALFSLWGLGHAYVLRKPEELGGIAVTGIDFSGANDFQWDEVLALSLLLWLLIGALCFCLFKVFTIYLRGGVFSAEAALWLRRAGLTGLVVILADFLWRSAIVYILAAHLPESINAKHMFVGTVDVFHVAIALILFALGQVQKIAAEIAGEHAQFV